MKNVLIIYCHPYEKSFNHAILEHIILNLQSNDINFKLIDLYADQFNPVNDARELKLYKSGQTADPLVMHYLEEVKESDELIFVSPIWWNDIPAMLKGFIDKVMKEGPNLSHIVTKRGVKGLLTNIKKTYIFTTSTSPTAYLKFLGGNGIKRIFIKQTLRQLGIKKCTWKNFGGITNSNIDRRIKYLEDIKSRKF